MDHEVLNPVPDPGLEGGRPLLHSTLYPLLSLHDFLLQILRRSLQLTASDTAAALLILPGGAPASSDSRIAALGRGPGRFSQQTLDLWAAEAWTGCGGRELREPLRCDDLQDDRKGLRLAREGCSALLVPLVDEGRSLGLLYVESNRLRHYSELHLDRLRSLVREAIPALYRLVLREHLRACGSEMELIGMSPALRDLERQILDAARYDQVPVLITGERGSGKELAAWAVHVWSARRAQPFVPVLLSGLPDTLVADELFGHERHSFTGAEDRRPGKFEAAGAGTVFLDEIGEINPTLQASLLRIVERNELSRIGRDLPVRVDARVVAATNRDLQKAMREGAFREDLYDRLVVFEVKVPPLRQRREDIPLLADHFLTRYCSELHRRAAIERLDVCRLCRSPFGVGCASPDFYEALATYDWPGNVRELKHTMFRLAATVREDVLQARHLPEPFRQASSRQPRKAAGSWDLDSAVRRHIEAVLEVTGHNKTRAALLLGIPYTTLQSKLKKLGVGSILPKG
ncbi:MAG TPA: sigma-54-dependent Fis family transcriptional regulator [Thermoanaerobaculia bacterium]|nr:sigma-54-dependent Fis family transcriptional regulator [Thermoanaerobaculia bacterium]